MKLTHLGHACLLVEAAGARVLIDPGTFSTVSNVRDLTAVLVTHQHADHLDPQAFGPLLHANPDGQVWLEPQALQKAAEALGSLGRLQGMASGQVIALGELSVTPVGQRHAVVHDYVPRIDNLGVVLRAEGEPSLFHPGDALDAEPGDVDVLCVPVNAPWARVADTVEFCRRIAPRRAVPIHEGLLNDKGRAMYLGHIGSHGADGGLEVVDLKGRSATSL